jgi:CubicO group peptidase (beta-lactamase class C family)
MVSRRKLLLATMAPAASMTTRTGDPLAPALVRLDEATRKGQVAAAVLHVEAGDRRFVHAFGSARPETVFLLASITKPMAAAAVMTLVEQKRLTLDDPVQRHLPGFTGGDRPLMTVRHLLNHTSGLPDQLPDNLALRAAHAPLRDFVTGALRAPLRFKPGTEVAYQSMGFLLAAEIAERITKLPFREYLRRTLLAPLGMTATSLGLGGRRIEDTALCQVPEDSGGWNGGYWRELGAPWGGAHGTAADVIKLLRFFAAPTDTGPLRPATARAMVTTSTPPGKSRYGLGWRLGQGGRGASPETFGHSGATGVHSWFDPGRALAFVLLTTWPSAQSEKPLLQPVSDLVSAAF